MGYAERNTWSQLLASVGAAIAYLALVVPQLSAGGVDGIEWAWPMVWCIAAGIAVSIAISVVWGIVAGARNPAERSGTDQRDREIEWFGDRVGQAFVAFGAIAALVLAMLEQHWFWIGNAVFAGFFLGAFLGGLARIGAYQRGMP